MRRAAALLSLVLLAACSTPCEELGDKFCSCYSGTTQDTCENQVQDQVDAANPSGAQEDFCQARLDDCRAPSGAGFCEWINTAAGKEACGLAYSSATEQDAAPAAN
jgi:hypothetical protein